MFRIPEFDGDYAWIITRDLVSDGDNVGVMGPKNVKMKADEIKENGRKFKMYDDDGELNYEGFLVGGDGFEPLDDFGTPDSGCTWIEYNGKRL